MTATFLGLCLLVFLDNVTLGAATNVLLVEGGRHHAPWMISVFCGLASALGAMVQLWAMRWFLSSRHTWARRLAPSEEKIHAALASHKNASFLALVFVRATPVPDLPLKIVAAAGGYPVPLYGLAVWLGALPYYYLLARIGRRFQPPLWVLIGGVGLIAIVGWLEGWRRHRAARRRSGAEPSSPS